MRSMRSMRYMRGGCWVEGGCVGTKRLLTERSSHWHRMLTCAIGYIRSVLTVEVTCKDMHNVGGIEVLISTKVGCLQLCPWPLRVPSLMKKNSKVRPPLVDTLRIIHQCHAWSCLQDVGRDVPLARAPNCGK
jgi:hypothetical protein